MSRINRLTELINDKTDCALITSDINRRYFCGMKSSAGTLVVFRDKAYLIIDFRYYEKACSAVNNCEVILQNKTFEQLEFLLKKHNAKTISVESKTMTLYELSVYRSKLQNYDIDTSDMLSGAITKLRSIKSKAEVEKIKAAQKIAENAFEDVLNHIKVGKTEKEIAFFLDSYMLKNGAEAVSFETIVLSGKNTSLPHGVPCEKAIQDGEFVLMDFGAVYDSYHSDMTRTVCVGKPDEEMKNVYNIVLEAQKAALSSAKSGIKGNELDKISRDVIEAYGYGENFGHSLGHSVGMEIHEYPNAAPSCDEILQAGTVITIEPGIYIPNKFGVRIEDFGMITSSDFENFTKAPNNLICL